MPRGAALCGVFCIIKLSADFKKILQKNQPLKKRKSRALGPKKRGLGKDAWGFRLSHPCRAFIYRGESVLKSGRKV